MSRTNLRRLAVKTMTDTKHSEESNPADATGGMAATPGKGEVSWDKVEKDDLEPTRYGDWEKNGRCIDF